MLEKFLPKKSPELPASQVTFGFLDRDCAWAALEIRLVRVWRRPGPRPDLAVDDSPILARDRRSAYFTC